MDTQEQHDRGLKLRVELFGKDAVEQRQNAFGEFGKPLQHIINAYAYGDVWSRSALPLATKSLTHSRRSTQHVTNARMPTFIPETTST